MKTKFKLPVYTNMTRSNEYRSRVHDLIPGGAHTYSKGDDQFPVTAPAAIHHGLGGRIWDVDGNCFLDCGMGLTSVTLGHAFEPVLQAVRKELEKGVNFPRPGAIELEMAEKFVAMIDGHDMVKFGKNGSSVTSAAVKLARAYTGRKMVAFPREHPFFSYDDWFIGRTDCNFGVPDEISSLTVTFTANDEQSLKDLFDRYPGQIACVISEPERNHGIPEGYLKRCVDLAHANGALYIADEMITGYKADFPGSCKKFGVVPDLATWGKSIGNGFSFCALTGKKDIMEMGGIRRKGQDKLFLISTTHGGETHGIAAGLATLAFYRNNPVIETIHSTGRALIAAANDIVSSLGLGANVEVVPCAWQPLFVFRENGEPSPALRTLVLQEMCRRGVLFQGTITPCFSHTDEDVQWFAAALEESLSLVGKAFASGRPVTELLEGPVLQPVFRKKI